MESDIHTLNYILKALEKEVEEKKEKGSKQVTGLLRAMEIVIGLIRKEDEALDTYYKEMAEDGK
jgi:hypothetical protein